ncbi:hypothetical protein HR10_08645 [Porphyromonas gulae]|uniref:Transposase n=1 Tax=Porphyromonas gulae TaxID=111105 RepID=A0A0A2FUI2_9PORP|nr:hypothetical protein HR15_01555 [Porphyromonas gulae]KKC50571.1 hypothetical protein HR10_08645 [Porphyromonas gulae]
MVSSPQIECKKVYLHFAIGRCILIEAGYSWHWAIENKLHHCLDVYFGHDTSHKKTKNVAQIMRIIQRVVLFIIE